jgi:hypothetical protein
MHSPPRHYAADIMVNSKSFAAPGRLLWIKVNAHEAFFDGRKPLPQARSLKF